MKTKQMKKHLSKLLVVTSLASVLIVFNQCVVQEYEEVGTADIEGPSPAALPVEPEVLVIVEPNIINENVTRYPSPFFIHSMFPF